MKFYIGLIMIICGIILTEDMIQDWLSRGGARRTSEPLLFLLQNRF